MTVCCWRASDWPHPQPGRITLPPSPPAFSSLSGSLGDDPGVLVLLPSPICHLDTLQELSFLPGSKCSISLFLTFPPLKHFLFLLGQVFCSHSQAVKTQFLLGQTQRPFGLRLPRFLLKQHGPTLSFSDPQLRTCKRTWPSKGAG